jgi:uncharacterized protein (TIGR03435 family)
MPRRKSDSSLTPKRKLDDRAYSRHVANRGLLTIGIALVAVIVPALSSIVSAPPLQAQAQPVIQVKPSGAKFEVASIKPVSMTSAGPPPHVGIKIDAARVDIAYWSLKQLILRAYGLPGYQLSGPEWLSNVRFDVAANFPEGANKDQFPQMLQWLLRERFGLIAHSETRNLPALVLTIGKSGPKMKLADDSPDDPAETASSNRLARAGRTLDSLWSYDKPFGLVSLSVTNGVAHSEFKKMSMDALAQILSDRLRAPVIDMTGLNGEYQVTLDLPVPGAGGSVEDLGESMFPTVQKLGLKLEQRKAPIAVLVVDHAERVPTEN